MHKHWLGNIMKTAQTARNMEENMKLQEIVANRCGKEISQCTNEELYYALLEMTKGMAEEKVSNQGKRKLYYISAEFLIGKLLSNNRPERTGTGTVRHHHGADENCRGRNRGIEAYPPNGMGAALQ